MAAQGLINLDDNDENNDDPKEVELRNKIETEKKN